MRKANREIQNFDEIVALLARCDTLHIGMSRATAASAWKPACCTAIAASAAA